MAATWKTVVPSRSASRRIAALHEQSAARLRMFKVEKASIGALQVWPSTQTIQAKRLRLGRRGTFADSRVCFCLCICTRCIGGSIGVVGFPLPALNRGAHWLCLEVIVRIGVEAQLPCLHSTVFFFKTSRSPLSFAATFAPVRDAYVYVLIIEGLN